MGSSITEAEHQPISSSPNSGNKAGSTPPQANTPPPSLNSSFNIGNTNTPNRNLLGLTPSDEVVFDVNNAGENNGLQAKLQIKNNSNKMVVFKIKTTSPEKYRVRPSASYIKANGSCDVEIHVHQSQLNDDQPGNNAVAAVSSSIISPEVSASLMKDKFLVTAITLEEDADENPSQSKLNELLKNNRPESQYRLRCTLTGTQFKSTQNNRLQSGSGKEITPTSSTLASANKQLENLSKKVNELKQTVNESAETITSLKKTTLIMLGIIMFLQLLLAYQVMSLNSESGNVTNSGDIINHQETHISDEKQEL